MKTFLKIGGSIALAVLLIFGWFYKKESDAIDLADKGLPGDTPAQRAQRRCDYARHFAHGRTAAEIPSDVSDLLRSCDAMDKLR